MKHSSARWTKMSGVYLLVVLACGGRSEADNTYIFNNFNQNESISFTVNGTAYNNEHGGNVVPSYLNGSPLSVDYCVQFSVDVYEGVSYTHTGNQHHGDDRRRLPSPTREKWPGS